MSGLAIWIFCCVIVHRWRRERTLLMLRAAQMPIQYVNVQYPGQFPGQFPVQPIDPNQKVPYPMQYSVVPSDPNMVQYPPPTHSPPQNVAQYASPVQSPSIQHSGYPPPSEASDKYPATIPSPVPSRQPLHSVQSDEFPTHYENQLRNP